MQVYIIVNLIVFHRMNGLIQNVKLRSALLQKDQIAYVEHLT